VEVAGSKGRRKGGKEKARGPRREGKNQEGTMSRNEKEKEKERSGEKRGGDEGPPTTNSSRSAAVCRPHDHPMPMPHSKTMMQRQTMKDKKK